MERRIRDAKFHEETNLEDFDWAFNAAAIDRAQIEQLATGEFVRRGENLVMVGQSGVGKSHLLQALGKRLCELGYRVRYTTSAELLQELRASLADQSLPRCIRTWSRFDLVIIDEFGFDRIERNECPEAANLLYKLIDARSGKRSTALGTNIDFEKWSDYLGDPPLAMAFLDRVVYRATALKICGKSYRATGRRSRPAAPSPIPPEAFRRGHHAGHRLSTTSTARYDASGIGPDRLPGDFVARPSASRPMSPSRLPLNCRSLVLRPSHAASLSLLRLPFWWQCVGSLGSRP